MISFTRIDNRLVHGQVIEGWLPHLKVRRVVVVDAESAKNPLARACMGLAVPESVTFEITFEDATLKAYAEDTVPTLVLIRDVAGAWAAFQHGIKLPRLNLGNIHFKSGRHAITPSVFLDDEELKELEALAQAGVVVEAQALPSEKPVPLTEIEARFRKSGASA